MTIQLVIHKFFCFIIPYVHFNMVPLLPIGIIEFILPCIIAAIFLYMILDGWTFFFSNHILQHCSYLTIHVSCILIWYKNKFNWYEYLHVSILSHDSLWWIPTHYDEIHDLGSRYFNSWFESRFDNHVLRLFPYKNLTYVIALSWLWPKWMAIAYVRHWPYFW